MVEFARNPPSMPCQDGVRLGDSRYLAESFAAQSIANLTESRPLSVRKPQPALQLSLQGAISARRYSFRSRNSWSKLLEVEARIRTHSITALLALARQAPDRRLKRISEDNPPG